MGEQRVVLEPFYNGGDWVVAADALVVALGHVVEHEDAAVITETGDLGEC